MHVFLRKDGVAWANFHVPRFEELDIMGVIFQAANNYALREKENTLTSPPHIFGVN